MKKLIFPFLLLLTSLCFAEVHPTLSNVKEIECISTITGHQLVFTNDIVRIEVAKSDLIDSLENWIEKHNVGWDREFLQFLKETEGNIDFHSLDSRQRERARFRITDLLLKGKVRVFDKEKSEYTKSYISAEWGWQTHPLIGRGGKIFFLKREKIEFFKVTEWVSYKNSNQWFEAIATTPANPVNVVCAQPHP